MTELRLAPPRTRVRLSNRASDLILRFQAFPKEYRACYFLIASGNFTPEAPDEGDLMDRDIIGNPQRWCFRVDPQHPMHAWDDVRDAAIDCAAYIYNVRTKKLYRGVDYSVKTARQLVVLPLEPELRPSLPEIDDALLARTDVESYDSEPTYDDVGLPIEPEHLLQYFEQRLRHK